MSAEGKDAVVRVRQSWWQWWLPYLGGSYTWPCKTEDGKEGKNEFIVKPTFLFSNDNELLFYKSNLGKALRTLKASGELVYFSANLGESLKQDVPLEGLVFREQVNAKCSTDATPK